MARPLASIISNGTRVRLISLADESGYGALTSTTLGIARAHHKIYVRDYHLRAASQPGMRLCWPEAGLLDSLVMEAAVDMHDHLVASRGDDSALVKFWKTVLECCVCFAEALLLLYAGAIRPPHLDMRTIPRFTPLFFGSCAGSMALLASLSSGARILPFCNCGSSN